MYLFISIIFILVSGNEADSRRERLKTHSALLVGGGHSIKLMEDHHPYETVTVMDGIEFVIGCDYIRSDNQVFWIDSMSDDGKIQSTFTNISYKHREKKDIIQGGLVSPQGIVCDWVTKKLYWTDEGTKRIEVCEVEGKFCKTLIWNELDHPRAIAVDPIKGYMYWTDWGEDPKIEKAGMDGSDRKTLVSKLDGIKWPNGLTIDYESQQIYWVDGKHRAVNRMNADGSGRTVVINSPKLKNSLDVTLLGDNIYWTNMKTYSVYSSPKNDGPEIVLTKNLTNHISYITSYSAIRQQKRIHPCNANNGGCSHLCLISPNEPFYSCACSTGNLMESDGSTCSNLPDAILLVATRTNIRMISLDVSEVVDVILPFKHVENAIGIDYDPVDDKVYWTNLNGTIYRSKLDGQEEQKVQEAEDQYDGIAVDWVARNLYWAANGDHKHIGVSRLDETYNKMLIEEDVGNPRAIVLDPSHGQMFWSDWGDHAKIERASLDGSDRFVLVNTSISWPNGLTIDYSKRLLYWGDAMFNRVEVIGVDGTGRRVLFQGEGHLFSLSFLDDNLYWSDWRTRRVEQLKLHHNKSSHNVMDEVRDLMGVKATTTDPIPATNPCADDNGGCPRLCLYSPKGVSCQ